jgi:dUTP pyrophosphatase
MSKLEVINRSGFPLERATNGSAGIDLYCAYTEQPFGDPLVVHTGIRVAIPEGHVGLLIPRSSLHQRGWQLANTVGVIDSDYRGEILVKLVPAVQPQISMQGQYLYPPPIGERIAQLVIVPCPKLDIVEVDKLDETERGDGGFGSTGR